MTVAGVCLHVATSLWFLFFGKVNLDEGWYLYASGLVSRRSVPYRDFAFSQMPLVPYVYAIPPWLFGPSLYVGRATSAVLSLAALICSIRAARNMAGPAAGAMTALLVSTFWYGTYFSVIVKTYALTSLCFSLTLLCLSSSASGSAKYIAAALFALLAGQTRVTANVVAIPVVILCWYRIQETPLRILLACVVGAIGSVDAWLALPDPAAMKWHLVDQHLEAWDRLPALSRLKITLLANVPDLGRFYHVYVVTAVAVAYLAIADHRVRTYIRARPEIAVMSAALAAFVAAQLATGRWIPEYYVPSTLAFLPLVSAVACHSVDGDRGRLGVSSQTTALLVGLIAIVILGGISQSVALEGRDRVRQGRELAAFIESQSEPSDLVLAFDALAPVFDAERRVPEGFEMARFAYKDVDTTTARRLHVVNYDMVARGLEQRAFKLAVLTAEDLERFAATEQIRKGSGHPSAIPFRRCSPRGTTSSAQNPLLE